nr:protein defective in meristem silencing 3 [Ipomoea batatas]
MDDKFMQLVDENGFINLGGVLKVTAGYGKKASLSVFSCDKAVFKQEFQIEARELRIASEIPEDCVPGSHLENIIFEVINSEGEVDESIHDDEKNGQPHTLTIKSELLKIDETVRYSFCHGRCTVRSITLPEDEGKFHFVAVHSRHMELQLCIEVNTKKAVEPVSGYFQSQSPEMQILNEEVENFQYQCAQKQIFSYENSSPYKVPKLEHDESEADRKKLEDELCHYAQLSSQCETDLQILESKQSNIQTEIFNLEVSLGLYSSPNCCCTQESIREKISGRGDSAAAIACKLIETPSSVELHHEFSKEILGVVALLGFAESYELSRVLAEYLGEKQMLAVVCNAHSSSAGSSKMPGKHGHLSSADALSTLANNLGTSINGGYDMICLNDIRPYTGELSIDPQRMLAMVKPALPNGESPPGFLGYAVNMIHISAKHLQFRTASGHGLRETLFYRLLGELQVYANRDCMSMASSCSNKHPAVSLDGVIMRGNGVTTHVIGEPFIMFPVISNEPQINLMTVNPDVLNLLNSKKIQLREMTNNILLHIASL